MLKKYKVDIPKPSAKRFLENKKKFIIRWFHTDWGGTTEHEQIFDIPEGQDFYLFEFDGDIENRDPPPINDDGNWNKFFVEFTNQTGSRKELIEVVPYQY